jgi:hypothetical protein
MANPGSLFQGLLNNSQPSFNWNTTPISGFQGGVFQSLLNPSKAAAPTPEAWNRTPQSILEYEDKLRKQGYSEERIASATSRSAPPPTAGDPGMDQIYGGIRGLMDQELYDRSPAGMREKLEMGRAMANAQAKDMLKWNTLANIPRQLERGFAADKYYASIREIPEIYRSSFASVPSMNIQAPGYSAPQVRYFS